MALSLVMTGKNAAQCVETIGKALAITLTAAAPNHAYGGAWRGGVDGAAIPFWS
jgi:hypothetical protein